ncbi:MAG TPA: dimethylsulfonioproprionate lyase family protein [Gemmatimonadales bacterium]|nr:dimethylsulfonioproprionate lyase family protein [Gemmatimonadales bacterium]
MMLALFVAVSVDTCRFDLPLEVRRNPDAMIMAAPLTSKGAVDSLGAYTGWLFLGPGVVVPEHDHGEDEEMLFVICGGSRFRVGDKEISLEPGSSIRIPRRTRHAAIIGAEGLVAVQVYRGGTPGLRYFTWDVLPVTKPK